MGTPLRKCVVAVVANDQKQYLVGERSDAPNAWQLPQGGVDEGETVEQAVLRELAEETGCGQADISRRSAQEIAYLFPPGLSFKNSRLTELFSGQSQVWFLLRFRTGEKHDLERSDGEFSLLCWKTKEQIIAEVVEFKKEAYIQGFAALGL